MSRYRPVIAFLALLLAAGSAVADTLVTSSSHTDAFVLMGQQRPARDETVSLWLGQGTARLEGEMTVLARFDQKKLYVLDAAKKTAYAVDLPIDPAKLVAADQQAMIDQRIAMTRLAVTVTPTDETRVIRGWNTRKYVVVVTLAASKIIEQVMWVTKDLALDYALYRDLSADTKSLNPMMADLGRELAKIDGIPVLTEITMTEMGTTVTTRQEIVSVEDKAAPAGTYEIPAGYEVKPYDFIEQMQGAK